MSNDRTIIDDLTPELVEKYHLPVVDYSIYKVYFDSVHNIIAITNSTRNTDENYFEINVDEIDQFLTGKENFNNYKVFLNKENQFEIIPKIIKEDFRSSILISIPQTDSPAVLDVANDLANKNWIIAINEEERSRLRNNIIDYTFRLFVTSSKNKNFLYRIITIDLNKLVNGDSVVVEHKSEIESTPNKIALSTIKFFNSYSLRTIYEV
jgi:hypothetical protein